MKVAFDSRPSKDPRGVGRYTRCLLHALHESAADSHEIVESHRPRRCDVFHAPWIDGALLRSPVPMVVTRIAPSHTPRGPGIQAGRELTPSDVPAGACRYFCGWAQTIAVAVLRNTRACAPSDG